MERPRMGARIWCDGDSKEMMWHAADCLRQGGLVAFPTETVYGLGADARNAEAIARLFIAKGRPTDNPLIVHVATIADAERLVVAVHDVERRLMRLFWPGPLTLVLPVRTQAVCGAVTAHTDRVAVRIPQHPIALELLRETKFPVAAPSANRSGRPSPTRAEHVLADLGTVIDGVIDAGAVTMGIESTVASVDVTGTVHVLRPGAVTAERLRDMGFFVAERGEHLLEGQPMAPGTRYVHYAPRGRMCVVEGTSERVHQYVRQRVRVDRMQGLRTGILLFGVATSEVPEDVRADFSWYWSAGRDDLTHMAQQLYAVLRLCDDHAIDRIYAESCPRTGLGVALMDRLLRAAGHDHVVLP